jgi:ketosteroid isomerase-like protein
VRDTSDPDVPRADVLGRTMMAASGPDEELLHTLDQVRAAHESMMAGDSGPWMALLSPRDDVVLLGAFGGIVRDRPALAARFDRTAQAYGGGERLSVERLATWVGADLACTVEVERHEGVRLAGHAPTTTVYRVTHLFRREADGWKVVLRHADPLVEFRGPGAVLPGDG